MPDETRQINLRPRLSIFEDIHPELFEAFDRIPESRQNALVMQMLVRMATIDRYVSMQQIPLPGFTAANVGSGVMRERNAPSKGVVQSPAQEAPAPRPVPAPSTAVSETIAEEGPTDHAISLKAALGGMDFL